MSNGNFGGGDGTVNNPYLVEDAQDLDAVRNNLTAHYKQVADVDLYMYTNWEPIGDINSASLPFTGSYDGGGFVVSNLSIYPKNRDEYYYADWDLGLFGGIVNATLENIRIKNFELHSPEFVSGGLVGSADLSLIQNCHSSGFIDCTTTASGYAESIGGLVGEAFDTDVFDSSSSIEIIATEESYEFGGLIGTVRSRTDRNTRIERCYSIGNIVCNTDAGGLIGLTQTYNYEGDDGIITTKDCYSQVDMFLAPQSEEGYNVGGLIGTPDYGTVTGNCYSTGHVPVLTFSGGLIGYGEGAIVTNCYYDAQKAGHYDEEYGTPKTTKQMKQRVTFVNWDFESIWRIDENSDYPRFRWEPIKCKAIILNTFKEVN